MQVDVQGSGPHLALLHGWGMNAGAWDPVLRSLAQHLTVHAVDLPGFGGAPAGVQEAGEVMDALLAALPERFSLLGWSWGGQWALELALRAPGRIERLVLVATPPRFVQAPDWPHGVTAAVFTQFVAGMACDPEGTLRRFFALQAQGLPEARQVMRDLRAAVAAHGGADQAALRAGLADLGARDLRCRVADCQLPTLVIQGMQDVLVPAAAGQWLAKQLPHAQLHMVAQAGHAPFATQPVAFIQAVTDFIYGTRLHD